MTQLDFHHHNPYNMALTVTGQVDRNQTSLNDIKIETLKKKKDMDKYFSYSKTQFTCPFDFSKNIG
jgi:hypothetical protein